MDKLNVILEKTGTIIIANSKTKKAFLFDINNVEKFIELSVELILSQIDEITSK